MKTAFSIRIDKDRIMDQALDADYFNGLKRQTTLVKLEQSVKQLEDEFKKLTAGKNLKLAELMQDPKTKAVLVALRGDKKKVDKASICH